MNRATPANVRLDSVEPAGLTPFDFSDAPELARSAHHQSPPSIPDHELICSVGHGSYGEVWLARNAVGTLRAVKIVHRQDFERADNYEREFNGLQKFEPISRSHDGLVDILQLGRNEAAGYFYYVMELADAAEPQNAGARSQKSGDRIQTKQAGNAGQSGSASDRCLLTPDSYCPHTLRCDLKRHDYLSLTNCVCIGLKLCSALDHLHKQGLVHRDIKPSNIVFVSGTPKLADIGLVTNIDEAHSIVGTSGYIPPEGTGTPQADIYSLGKVLYEMAFGKDRQEFPQLPPDLHSRADHDGLLELNEIILKACEGDVRERYQTAEAMAADLALLERGGSVMRQRTRQRRWAAVPKFSLALILLALLSTGLLFRLRTRPDGDLHSKDPRVDVLVAEGILCTLSWTPERLDQALAYFTQAVDLDRTFVPAYVGLFTVPLQRGDAAHPGELRAAATKLMEVAPHFGEGRIAAANIKWLEGRRSEALAEARAAAELRMASKDGRGLVHSLYGVYLLSTGNYDAALRQYQLAEQATPYDPVIKKQVGDYYFAQGDFERALKWYQASTSLEPRFTPGYQAAGTAYEEMGDFHQAIEEFKKCDKWSGENRGAAFYDELLKAVEQDPAQGYWRKRLQLAMNASTPDSYGIAHLFHHLGATSTAYEWLERSIEQHEDFAMMVDPCWDRSDPQFNVLAKRVQAKH